MEQLRMQFCEECRKETSFHFQYISYKKCIREKEYIFDVWDAICDKCGKSVYIPGLSDTNAQEIDKQYRAKEDIVSVTDISNLMKIYNIGKAPLSLALGFGEITITRYLAGQVPSKEYSDIIRNALQNPEYMKKRLKENRDKIGDIAYNKAMASAKEMEPLSNLSDKMLLSISYIFYKEGEVTPLSLQKMLYYIQGIYMVTYNAELFRESCQAWLHGPVYKDVYNAFKEFMYNPIDDVRFVMFRNRFNELSDKERKVIDLVINTFGRYSGKIMEQITHTEEPWVDARRGCLPGEASCTLISNNSIKAYFSKVNEKYNITTGEGINRYIKSRLERG